jgi:hypothetical protein
MQELQAKYNVQLDAFQFGEKVITMKQMESLYEEYQKSEKTVNFEKYVENTLLSDEPRAL